MMMDCDTLLMVGSSFPYGQFLPEFGKARAVQSDVDPTMIGMRYPFEVNMVGDAGATLRRLLPLLRRRPGRTLDPAARHRHRLVLGRAQSTSLTELIELSLAGWRELAVHWLWLRQPRDVTDLPVQIVGWLTMAAYVAAGSGPRRSLALPPRLLA